MGNHSAACQQQWVGRGQGCSQGRAICTRACAAGSSRITACTRVGLPSSQSVHTARTWASSAACTPRSEEDTKAANATLTHQPRGSRPGSPNAPTCTQEAAQGGAAGCAQAQARSWSPAGRAGSPTDATRTCAARRGPAAVDGEVWQVGPGSARLPTHASRTCVRSTSAGRTPVSSCSSRAAAASSGSSCSTNPPGSRGVRRQPN